MDIKLFDIVHNKLTNFFSILKKEKLFFSHRKTRFSISDIIETSRTKQFWITYSWLIFRLLKSNFFWQDSVCIENHILLNENLQVRTVFFFFFFLKYLPVSISCD